MGVSLPGGRLGSPTTMRWMETGIGMQWCAVLAAVIAHGKAEFAFEHLHQMVRRPVAAIL